MKAIRNVRRLQDPSRELRKWRWEMSIVVMALCLAVCFGAAPLEALCIICIERWQQQMAKQAAWDKSNKDWMRENGFDASVGHDLDNGMKDYARILDVRNTAVVENRTTYYQLGNQAPFTVAMGPASLQFRGALVRMF